jgi:hypothetical protein
MEQNEWAGERKPIKNSFNEIRDRWRACAREEDPIRERYTIVYLYRFSSN